MITIKLPITNDVGLHARPAATFVKAANQFRSKIQVKNLSNQKGPVDAKSILRVLSLGAEKGSEIELTIDGEDEAQAGQTLEALVRSDFAGTPA